ncbi:MAG: YbaN family protein [Candidatus Izemoplasmataceae bacterium]|jgi:uncharacterized protein|uniref:YbaN family protein n=1 Tax=Liberiplasma polymorphum TaxID=3374570 RepID=UPI00377105B1
MSKSKRILFIFLGSLFLTLGTIGIILPLLPTTPFLLLTGYFYAKSSDRLYQWLIHHKVFGIYIYSYITYKAIDIKTKIGAIILLWTTLSLSSYMMYNLYLTMLLGIIGLGVTTHLLMLKTLSKEVMIKKRHAPFVKSSDSIL